ncbi:hypothetical protein [Emticicia sp. BO119]|uniref:hypothetical protein n=1 Tax=Emticicia sp. BO119 TaxID=2757768 RepID=UPI0015F11EDB|nr:hypothetical protein [Emticicia sp. BO119]
MKFILFCLFLQLFFVSFTFAQDVIEWSPDYKVSISDFQSKSTQIGHVNQYSILLAAHMDFSFHMSTYEFMLTKNFNSKVATTFTRSASVLIAPDSNFAQKLVKYAQLSFDLTELYARKFRKNLYESKGFLSEVNFFQEAYKPIEIEYNARIAEIGKLTGLGQSEVRIEEAHQQVLKEIEELPDFCKTCKPKKKKK